MYILCFFFFVECLWRKEWYGIKDKNAEKKIRNWRDSGISHELKRFDNSANIEYLESFVSLLLRSSGTRMASCFEVFHVPVALQKLARRGEASRARLYIKWCSWFTSQIESRAIGRFSISFNNGLCYTSPTSSSPLFLFSSSHYPYFRLVRSRISPQERIHRYWGFLQFGILKSVHRQSAWNENF